MKPEIQISVQTRDACQTKAWVNSCNNQGAVDCLGGFEGPPPFSHL